MWVDSPDNPAGAPWRPAGFAALAAVTLTRLPILLIGTAAVIVFGTWPPPTAEALWRVSPTEVGNLLARWDTFWYHSIATGGYHWDATVFRHENVVFFPLYPLLMRVGGQLLGGHPLVAGVLVSLVSFAGAMALLHRFAADELGEEYAWPVILLISTYPFALFYSTVYTESLFLFLTVGAFYAMGRGHLFLAALAGLAAGLTRPNGCWLAAPLLWMALESRLPRRPPRRVTAMVAALAPLAGTTIYSAYLFSKFGDALAWVHGQAAWGVQILLRRGAEDGVPFVRDWTMNATDVLNWIFNIVAFAVAILAIRPVWRRFGPPYALWIGLSIFPPFLAHLFMSVGRFTAVLFPLFFWLVTIVPRAKLWRVAGWFAAIQGGFAILFFLWRPVV